MNKKEIIQYLITSLQHASGRIITTDTEAIDTVYQNQKDEQSLPIKILSIFGGIMACMAFFGFLLIAGFESWGTGLIVFGVLSIFSALWICKKQGKVLIDTIGISMFLIGYLLLWMGLEQVKVSQNDICVAFILIGIAALLFSSKYMLSFLSILMIHGSVLSLLMINSELPGVYVYSAFLTFCMSYVFLFEARIIATSKRWLYLYNPLRIALVLSFASLLLLLSINGALPLREDYLWLASVFIILALIYVLARLFAIVHLKSVKNSLLIYVLCLLIVIPTAMSPGIAGALLIILLSVLVHYKTSLVIGIIALLYFVGLYYYDLNYTLLTKSMLLFWSGFLFIVLYLFTRKNLSSDEKDSMGNHPA